MASKITVPSVPEWAVARPRITKLVAEGARWCPLTVVTGPPGAGKTMALALWAAAEPGTVAWVGLDEFDNRPGVFWSYVVAALRRSGVAVPKTLRGVAQEAGDDGFLLRLTAALADLEPPVTLVLDDLHLLTEAGVLKGLEFVLRNVGAGLRLVVASRMDPLLPLHRYRLAGELTEIRAADLAFSTDEAGLLLAQHGGMLSAEGLESLTERTEGWAAGLRLAAISLGTHPDPGQFVKELVAEDSALIGYLVDEVLNVAPPEVREVLLSTSILEHVSAGAAVDLTGNEQAGAVLMALVRTNAFVQPIGSGWYRYHTLFAEMLRLKLRHEHPDRVPVLHRRAARWYERNGLLTDAVRHAARAGDWQLAAGLVIDQLAVGQVIEPRDGPGLADEFADMPLDQAWTRPQPYLVAAALALSAGRYQACAAALDAADGLLGRCPADQQAASRLAAAVIRLTACLRTGDLTAAATAASRAEVMLGGVPDAAPAGHRDLSWRVLSGRAAVALWSGQPDAAARLLEAGAAGAAAGGENEHAGWAGQLALAEALRGRLGRAADLAGQATQAALAAGEPRPAGSHPGSHPDAAPLVALAWVHLQRHELRETRGWIKQADAALGACPDKLTGTLAYLVAAGGALAEGRATVAAQIITRARSAGPVPAWLDQQLSLAESRACSAAGDTPAALAAAERAGPGTSPEAAVALAHAWAAAGDSQNAQHALAPALTASSEVPDRVRLQAWLTDARLAYTDGDGARGRRSLASALRLAEREQVRLPFVIERGWLGPVFRRDPELAGTHRSLLAPALGHEQLPAPRTAPDQAPVLMIEPLTDREREVLVHVSGMLNTAEVASEMYISVNTVKTHLRNIYRKLAAAHRSEAVRRARQLELI
ncbi:MAG TPA: LuxR C-terminal-related transcriptional regulator [Streptosporangiaceae bacterium]|nr:LuxR C-terminal-related transcriptional regulator [Streptosporangiaceae bacterium]